MTTDMEFLEPVQRWRQNVTEAPAGLRQSLIRQWKEKILEDLVDALDCIDDKNLFLLHGNVAMFKLPQYRSNVERRGDVQ